MGTRQQDGCTEHGIPRDWHLLIKSLVQVAVQERELPGDFTWISLHMFVIGLICITCGNPLQLVLIIQIYHNNMRENRSLGIVLRPKPHTMINWLIEKNRLYLQENMVLAEQPLLGNLHKKYNCLNSVISLTPAPVAATERWYPGRRKIPCREFWKECQIQSCWHKRVKY